MLMPLEKLVEKYDLTINGVFHLGAHLGEELEAYEAEGVPQVVWVEGDPETASVLSKRLSGRPRHRVINALVDETEGNATFHIANNGQSSSILEFGTHSTQHPEVVYLGDVQLNTTTIDKLWRTRNIYDLNFWNLDIQGAELRALKGAKEALHICDYIYTEVNFEEVYRGCALIEEIDEYLSDFVRVETLPTPHGWGDAFYVRNETP